MSHLPDTFHVAYSRQDWQGGGEQGRAGVQAKAQGDYAVLRQLPLAGAFCLIDFQGLCSSSTT